MQRDLGRRAHVHAARGALLGVVQCFSFVAALCACGNDRNDLFCSPGECDAGPAATLTPYEAALRVYGDDEACVECVEDECGAAALACADDQECAEDAACRAECATDPACQYWSCRDQHPLDDRPTFPLEDCVIARCPEPCRVGRAFECVGEYTAPSPEPDQPVVIDLLPTFLGTGEPGPEGLRVRVCVGTHPECGEVVNEYRTDAAGAVTVELPAPREQFGALLPFHGYVEITDDHDPPRASPVLIAYALPEAPPRSPMMTWAPALTTPAEASALFAALRTEEDPSMGVVVGVVYDCRLSDRARAGGITVEVTPSDSSTRATYDLTPGATATKPAPNGGGFAVGPLQPGVVTFTAFHEGQTVVRAQLPVRAGFGTELLAWPAGAN